MAEDKEQLRAKHLQSSIEMGKVPRYGLFSSPGPNAVGDNSMFPALKGK
jgi:hypothetical protein